MMPYHERSVCESCAHADHFADRDPWVAAGRAAGWFRPGFVGLGEDLVSPPELRQTPFFNELGRRFNILGGVAAVWGSPGGLALLSVNQHRFRQFGEAERRLVAALMPHLTRALAVPRRFVAHAALQRATADVLDRLPTAAILVDGETNPIVINRAARVLIARGDGLHSAREGLIADRAADTQALRALVAVCAATSAGEGWHPGGTLQIARSRTARPLQVMVAPIRLEDLASDVGRPGAILFVHDPAARLEVAPDTLRALHGLTSAEARVAVQPAAGHTVSEICGLLHLSPNTVRTHVKRLLQKTQTRTQGQLVHVLLTGLGRIER